MSPVVTRSCVVCKKRVQPQLHCPETNRYCDWWKCPVCKSDHCNGRVIAREMK